MNNKYITILNFEIGKVFQYEIKEKDEFHAEDYYEIFITQKGHHLSNCQWMVHKKQGFECKPLTKSQSDWYEYFTDYIQEIDHNKYNQACEYADNKTKD